MKREAKGRRQVKSRGLASWRRSDLAFLKQLFWSAFVDFQVSVHSSPTPTVTKNNFEKKERANFRFGREPRKRLLREKVKDKGDVIGDEKRQREKERKGREENEERELRQSSLTRRIRRGQ